jgi:predicted nucleic acid-binding protein
LIDTGPLVAYLDRREAMHPWVRETFSGLQAPFFTCEAVLTEACFLLRRTPRAIRQIAGWLEAGLIKVPFRLADFAEPTFALMEKYRDQPMSLADASLVAMIETGAGDRVFTLDQDFRVYRHAGRRVVPVLMPD